MTKRISHAQQMVEADAAIEDLKVRLNEARNTLETEAAQRRLAERTRDEAIKQRDAYAKQYQDEYANRMRLSGMIDMLERLGTIPREEVKLNHYDSNPLYR